MTHRALATAAVALLTLTSPPPIAAQDAHYWTYGYGPVGQLTEGTLVGGVEDLSAVYYNPGALALIEQPRFVIGLTSVQFAKMKIPAAAGPGLDVNQTIFNVVPSMIAGHLGENRGQATHFAFAFLARHDSDWDLGYTNVQVSGSSPDAMAALGRSRQRLIEYWVGGTWSHRLRERLAVGVSPFFAYRAQRSRRALTSEDITTGVSTISSIGREYDYDHVRLMAKAGVAWRPGTWELGANVTVPGVKLWSSGKSIFNATVAGGTPTPFLTAAVQSGMSATYHAPWSVGAGATWRRARGAIHATVEWFSHVAEYDILEPDPAPIAGSSETVPLTYHGESRSVVCYGVGLEQHLGSRVILYGGAAHNESAYVANRDTFAAWDLTDITWGFTFDTGRAKVAFGLGYAWGSKAIQQPLLLPNQTGPPPTLEAQFSRWTISVGASFMDRR